MLNFVLIFLQGGFSMKDLAKVFIWIGIVTGFFLIDDKGLAGN